MGKCLLIGASQGKEGRILVIGDLHLGYEESLNESGVFVMRQLFREMIGELDRVFELAGKVDKVILLGDVKHVFSKNIRQEWNDVLELFDYFLGKMGGEGEIVVTRGNHDNYLKTIAGKRNVKVEDYVIVGDVGFLHGDRVIEEVADNEKIKKIIIGHFHPAVNLSDGNKIEKYKCFLEGEWKGKEIIVVPSFVEYGGGSDLRDGGVRDVWGFKFEKFNVKIVGEGLEVWDFGKLNKL